MADQQRDETDQTEWQRRRRLARVFGDELPDSMSDRDAGDEGDRADSGSGESAGDRWLKSQVPPHHGG